MIEDNKICEAPITKLIGNDMRQEVEKTLGVGTYREEEDEEEEEGVEQQQDST